MTVDIKSLADGQLAASKATLYTAPAATQAVANSISLVNTDSSARTVNLYFKASGGTSRRIIPKDLSLAVGAEFTLNRSISLEAADILEGDASAANVVDFVISGVENA
ncbi:hypothetical protein LCGC14_0416600 [marine sediment metagenome]|uniref:Uncharacterized protein n=1 Tax=marine sediment metagenome TaxID=412755 RepID=A0A0F9VE25_9ZZZZ